MSVVDLKVENHGSIFLLRPVSSTGQDWIDEHVDPEAQTLGNAVAVEHRYIRDIVEGAMEDGLVVA